MSECVKTDEEAIAVIDACQPMSEEANRLLDIAKKTSRHYSFVDHQTYPRPGHPDIQKRLSPLFTIAGVLISYQTTLELESRAMTNLIEATGGIDENLITLSKPVLQEKIKVAGFSNNKSNWILNATNKLYTDETHHPDVLKHGEVATTREKLLKLKGIGQKGVDCFMLLGLEMPVFPVDTNVFRVTTSNLPNVINNADADFGNAGHVRKVKEFLESNFDQNAKLYKVLHTYLLLAGKYKVDAS